MFLGDAAENAHVANNRVTGDLFGIWVDLCTVAATGYTLNNNDTSGGAIDIYLGPGSFENTVITTDFDTFVVDDGTDNRLLGTSASENNPAAAALGGLIDALQQAVTEANWR